ncbi:MAG: HlyD family efflux transporter periplasmic adaptor subunit, partial [Pseudomonadota bacterium]
SARAADHVDGGPCAPPHPHGPGQRDTCDDAAAIGFIAVNDTHRLIPYDHALLWLQRPRAITAISGGLQLDPRAPQITWMADLARHLTRTVPVNETRALSPDLVPAPLQRDYKSWIANEAQWVPLSGPKDQIVGGLILLRATAFTQAEERMLARLGSAYGFAFKAHEAPRRRGAQKRLSTPLKAAAIAVLIVGAALIPVPMNILGEAQVAAIDPVIVSAPLAGVVDEIHVKPNQTVRAGHLLFTYDASELAAEARVATKRLAVLRADSRRAEAEAFRDPKAKSEIGLLRARLAEGQAALQQARSRLDRVQVRAPRDGLLLLADPTKWSGRPVKVGERIMQIADPTRARLRIMVAVEDAAFAKPGGRVDFFLATAPRAPIRATLTRVNFIAETQPGGMLAFVADARFDGDAPPPRLGLTGTARITSARVSLGYLLLRKPLATLRRFFGL